MNNDIKIDFELSDCKHLGITELKMIKFYFKEAFKNGYEYRHPMLNNFLQSDYRELSSYIRLREAL
jgi:hypothetical protein